MYLSSVLFAFGQPPPSSLVAAMNSGTGYGHSGRGEHGPVWDSKKAGMMQAAHDAELQRVLRRLARLLFAALLAGTQAAPQTPPSSPRPGPRCAVDCCEMSDIRPGILLRALF